MIINQIRILIISNVSIFINIIEINRVITVINRIYINFIRRNIMRFINIIRSIETRLGINIYCSAYILNNYSTFLILIRNLILQLIFANII